MSCRFSTCLTSRSINMCCNRDILPPLEYSNHSAFHSMRPKDYSLLVIAQKGVFFLLSRSLWLFSFNWNYHLLIRLTGLFVIQINLLITSDYHLNQCRCLHLKLQQHQRIADVVPVELFVTTTPMNLNNI